MGYLRKRFSIAAGVATTLLLLALPSLASANPGTGPDLVQRSGRLVVLHADRNDGTSTEQWQLVNGSSRVDVHAPDDVWITPGTRVRLEGTLVGDTLLLADSETAVTETGAAPMLAASGEVTATAAVQNTAVILINFRNGSQWGGTNADATSLMFGQPTPRPDSLSAYYQEETYGQVSFQGTVFGPVDITAPTNACDSNAVYNWASLAEAAARVSDFAYQHYVFVYPTLPSCLFSGEAEIGGRYVWVNGTFAVRVLAHELGHNLGLAHAGGLACTSGGVGVSVGGTCDPNANAVDWQYGDPFDPMGRSQVGLTNSNTFVVRQMSMAHKLALGLLPSSAVKIVGASGTYHLAPMETLTGSAELLRIPKQGGGNYYVEYRWPIGYFDGQAPSLQGVFVRTDAPASTDPNRPDTSLIDMHPATYRDWSDAAMEVNEVFSDPVAAISIQDLGQDANGATLSIDAPRDVVPPNAPTGLTAVANGTSAILHWTAATDDYQVDSYIVSRDGAAIANPTGTDFQDSDLVPGTTVNYAVAAVDAGGNTGPATSVSVVIPDTVAPSASAKVSAKLTRDGQVHMAWIAAADNGRVSYYRVLRNGKAIATGNALTYVDKSARPGSGSTVTYSVVAIDLAGNVGAPGKAAPLRAALMRKLAATSLTVTRIKIAGHAAVRVRGKVSDAKARCRLRIGAGAWHACKAKASGAFAVTLPARGTTPVTLSLRDSLGRVKTQTLRVR